MRTTQALLLGQAPTRIHLFKPPKPPNRNINQEHTMDWIIWLFILIVITAIVGGIIGLIIWGLIRLFRRPRNANPWHHQNGTNHGR